MRSAVAILTYKRRDQVKAFLDSVLTHCPGVPVAVFEDCGSDGTVEALADGAAPVSLNREFDADHYKTDKFDLFAGRRNLGVTAQSNRALRWFEQSGAEHLCLCNDDLIATGDFVREYACAHVATENHLFTFCDFESDPYKALTVPFRGFEVRLQPRMTGMMMSLTSHLFKRIGYFDQMWLSPFGEDHCDWNNRAYFTGLVHINGQAQRSLDIVSRHLKSVNVPSTIPAEQRPELDKLASESIKIAAEEYDWYDHYRPFGLVWPRVVGGAAGVSSDLLDRCGYHQVTTW